MGTAVCVPLTSNLRWADCTGKRHAPCPQHGLPKDSVANLSQIITIDRTLLSEHVGRVSRRQVELLLAGLDVVLGR